MARLLFFRGVRGTGGAGVLPARWRLLEMTYLLATSAKGFVPSARISPPPRSLCFHQCSLHELLSFLTYINLFVAPQFVHIVSSFMSEQGTRTLKLSTPGVQTTAGAQVKLGACCQQEDTEKKVVDWCRENPVTVCVCTCVGRQGR